jgi:hypothetical protein
MDRMGGSPEPLAKIDSDFVSVAAGQVNPA